MDNEKFVLEAGRFKARNGDIFVVEWREPFPAPSWLGYMEGNSRQRGRWKDNGEEYSGYKRWDLIEKIEEQNVPAIS